MKKITFYILTLFLLLTLDAYSQSKFSEIDEDARNVVYNSEKSLAKELTKNCSTDLEKVRAIFIWVTDNIAYDFKLFHSPKIQKELYTSKNEVIEHVLKTRKAVCAGYSYLFKNLCHEVNIECVTIIGFSKQYLADGHKNKKIVDHAWNGVKIGNKWFLLDATWASGNSFGNQFTKEFDDFWFLTDPKKFIYTHFPEKSKWQLLSNPFSKDEFDDLPSLSSHRFFTQGVKVISPENGIIKISSDSTFIFKIKKKNPETKTSLFGAPWKTYATIHNLPEPTEEEYRNDLDKYSLLIRSLKVIDKKINDSVTTIKYKVIQKPLETVNLSINGNQAADYKVEWENTIISLK